MQKKTRQTTHQQPQKKRVYVELILSDVDVLVEFGTRPITLLHYCGFREELSEALRLPVDVVKHPLSEEISSYFEINRLVPLYER